MTTATTTTIDPAVSAPAPERRHAHIDHHLDVDVRREGRALVVHLSGRLDWVTAPALRDQLTSTAWRRLLLDLTELEGLDSHGTGTVILTALEARRRRARIALAVPDPGIADVLGHVGVGLAVPIVATVGEARRLLGVPTSEDQARPQTIAYRT